MKKQSIKCITYFISILLALCGGIANTPSLKAQNNNQNKLNNVTKNNNQSLIKTKAWKNIQSYWKKLNAIEKKSDYNSNYKELNDLQIQLETIVKDIDTLNQQNYLSLEQSNYLNSFIKSRVRYLEFSMGAIKCYKMSVLGSQIAQTRGDLEKRYDTLEKLFQEEKIDQKTFNLTKQKIIEDIKFIDNNANNNSNLKTDKRITDLIILLNK